MGPPSKKLSARAAKGSLIVIYYVASRKNSFFISKVNFEMMNIPRHKTAIIRNNLSRPIQVALLHQIINKSTAVFDYGCGRGDDIRVLESLGFNSSGWDPAHNSKAKKKESDIVNLGYVVNVIEDPSERIQALKEAYSCAEKVLIVSARLTLENRKKNLKPYGDGFLTQKNTFQKFYTQGELKEWIDETLKVNSSPAAPGIFFVFKDDNLREEFEASKYRRRAPIEFSINAGELYKKHNKLLDPIIEFYSYRGRWPEEIEIKSIDVIREVFGSLKRAFGVIQRVSDTEECSRIAKERSNDLLIYLGLARFGRRPKISQLNYEIQRDIKAFLGSYKVACNEADNLLFSAGKQELIDKACQEAPCGKLTHDALYVHESGLPTLSPILRMYEGCAKSYIGEVEGANIIKLHRGKPQISYLSYPKFDSKPHPALEESLVVPLKNFDIRHYNYRESTNPPILHRKEEFVPKDYTFRDKFARLTHQEEKYGLFDNSRTIGTQSGWREVLAEKELKLSGHRVVKNT